MIWEWFDEPINSDNKEIVIALRHAKSAKMKLIGTQYHDKSKISSAQLKAIKEVLEMYEAKGGGI